MQTIFRLPWCSDPHAPKMVDSAALGKVRASATMDIPMLQNLKRKRAISSEVTPLKAPDCKKLRPAETCPQILPYPAPQPALQSTAPSASQSSPVAPALASAAVSSDAPGPRSPASVQRTPSDSAALLQAKDATTGASASFDSAKLDTQGTVLSESEKMSGLQKVIENEFNMQILMKHNELRLIEQELAKCQIALEQLRRCKLRPYPGSDSPSQAVSSGTGPAILPQLGFSRPSHPTPHGVTDGPYSRHYRNWLLHDPQFDSVPMQMLHPDAAGRPTRHAGSTRRSVAQPFTFPGRPAEKSSSINNFPAPPSKERNQPNVLRRSTDGQLVKLICNNCQRGNFSSIQGFLNHCRIAHKVDYKSHDAAAIDCGRLLEEGEAANLPEPQPTPSHKPTPTRTSFVQTTGPVAASSRNLIHPLNSPSGASLASSHATPTAATRKPAPSLVSRPPNSGAVQLKPSDQLPRLSAHFNKHHIGGDLAKAVADARQTIDIGAEEELSSPELSGPNTPVAGASGFRTVASNQQATLGAANDAAPRPSSRKGYRQLQQLKPRPSPLMPPHGPFDGLGRERGGELESPHPHDHNLDLSPHGADSNPGLVSDHEDDDHGSASESEDQPLPHPDSHASQRLPVGEHRRSCGDDVDIDVAMEGMDEDGLIIRRSSDALREVDEKFGPSGK